MPLRASWGEYPIETCCALVTKNLVAPPSDGCRRRGTGPRRRSPRLYLDVDLREDAVGDAAVGGDVGLAVGADLDQAGAGGEGRGEVGERGEVAVGEVEESCRALHG